MCVKENKVLLKVLAKSLRGEEVKHFSCFYPEIMEEVRFYRFFPDFMSRILGVLSLFCNKMVTLGLFCYDCVLP